MLIYKLTEYQGARALCSKAAIKDSLEIAESYPLSAATLSQFLRNKSHPSQ